MGSCMKSIGYAIMAIGFVIAAIISIIRWFCVNKEFKTSSFIVIGVYLACAVLNIILFLANK